MSATEVGWYPLAAKSRVAPAMSWARRSAPRGVRRRVGTGPTLNRLDRSVKNPCHLSRSGNSAVTLGRYGVAVASGDSPSDDGAVVVVRLWLPDRPGALGAVASRIGGVKGDVIAIDVLERGGGRAVDELTVALPDPALVDLLVSEIGHVDGVDVEDVRPAAGHTEDRVVLALRALRRMTLSPPEDLSRVACRELMAVFAADWVALLDGRGGLAAAAGSAVPDVRWLGAFVAGAGGSGGAADELASAELAGPHDDHRRHLVVSRSHLPLRSVEREVLGEVATILGHLLP